MYNSDLPTRAELPSSKHLLRSTIIAIVVASILLVTVVLPSEYGIDPTRIGGLLGLTEMGKIKMSLAEEAKREETKKPEIESPKSPTVPAANDAAHRQDEMSLTLKPGEGAEIKLAMVKGANATYEWNSTGGPVNHDTHGDGPGGAAHSYSKGTKVERDAGELTAPFSGNHGWFWRNRTGGDVMVTLKTSGKYSSIKRVA